MKNIEQATLKRMELANPPQMIEQDDLTLRYVNKWKSDTENALRIGRGITPHKLEDTYGG